MLTFRFSKVGKNFFPKKWTTVTQVLPWSSWIWILALTQQAPRSWVGFRDRRAEGTRWDLVFRSEVQYRIRWVLLPGWPPSFPLFLLPQQRLIFWILRTLLPLCLYPCCLLLPAASIPFLHPLTFNVENASSRQLPTLTVAGCIRFPSSVFLCPFITAWITMYNICWFSSRSPPVVPLWVRLCRLSLDNRGQHSAHSIPGRLDEQTLKCLTMSSRVSAGAPQVSHAHLELWQL